MRFNVNQETRVGARHNNQDRIGYIYTKESAILICCDGMGGHDKGELAAEFVVHFLAKQFKQKALPKLEDPANFLIRYVISAHEQLIRFALKEGMPNTPRTTCVVAVVQDGMATWANVGDSRLYMMRGGDIFQKTKDHSHVQKLIDAGRITEQEALVHPERNKIYNCIGQPIIPRVDVTKNVVLKQNDMLLLGTDGLWGPLPPILVAKTLERYGTVTGMSMLMDVSESVTGKTCDNLSGVAFRWQQQEGNPVRDEINIENEIIDDAALSIAMDAVRAAILGKEAFPRYGD